LRRLLRSPQKISGHVAFHFHGEIALEIQGRCTGK
jgi:hypothetical protein